MLLYCFEKTEVEGKLKIIFCDKKPVSAESKISTKLILETEEVKLYNFFQPGNFFEFESKERK